MENELTETDYKNLSKCLLSIILVSLAICALVWVFFKIWFEFGDSICDSRWAGLRHKYTIGGGCRVGTMVMGKEQLIPEKNVIINYQIGN